MCSDRSQCTQGTRDKWVQSGNDQGWRIMFLPADRSWLALFYQLLSFKLWNYPASSVVSVWLTTAVAIKTNATPCLFCSLSPSVQASLSRHSYTTIRQKIPNITTSVSIIPRGAKRTYRERTCAPIKNAFVTYVRWLERTYRDHFGDHYVSTDRALGMRSKGT